MSFSKLRAFLCNTGHARNIYFSFDVVHDTAIDVAIEMVRELEISDWEPLEIAEMIEDEISSLVPTWKDWGGTTQSHNQHSFSYKEEEEDNDSTHHPFYSSSSCSSSQACLPAFTSSYKTHNCGNNVASGHDWLQGIHFSSFGIVYSSLFLIFMINSTVITSLFVINSTVITSFT